MTYRRMAAVVAVTIALAASCPGTAVASVGVGTTTPRIVIDQDVQPGGIYDLPLIPVMNTGTERSDFKVFVDRASEQTERFVDPRWIQVTPAAASIDASRSVLVRATIYVPLTAPSGEYQALIVAQPVVPGASANTPSVQVGTKVVFRVVQSNLLVALFWRVLGLLMLWAPWSYIGLGFLVVVPAVWYISRRYRFAFAVTRRS